VDGGLAFRVKELFRKHAGADARLQPHEVRILALSLAAQLGVQPSVFGDLERMFLRFDFSGDGVLDEEEGVRLIACMLHLHHDAQDGPALRARRFSAAAIPHKRLDQVYAVGRELGKGGQGVVYLARDRRNEKERVVKYYDKQSANAPTADIVEEFNLLTKLDHPKIARIYEVFQDFKNIYVVSEPYYGGDLLTCTDKAKEAGVRITEGWLAGILTQVCEGVTYLHGHKTMHCDLKEANVMVTQRGSWQAPSVVVIDFGLARSFAVGAMTAGTPGYMPAEVWETGLWTPKGDVFSLGVIFYRMFCMGHVSPFHLPGYTTDDIRDATLRGCPDLERFATRPAFKYLVGQMLRRDFHVRPAMAKLKGFQWWTQAPGRHGDVLPSGCEEALMKVAALRRKDDLYSALVGQLASSENLAQLHSFNDLFRQLDKDGDGEISEREAREGLRGKLAPEAVDRLVKALLGKSGKVAYTRFMGEMLALKHRDTNEVLWRLFCDADADGSGRLSRRELQDLLHKRAVVEALGSGTSAAELMHRMDFNGDGTVEFWEFKKALLGDSTGGASGSLTGGKAGGTGAGGPEVGPTCGRESGSLRIGGRVEYYSQSLGQWVQATVTQTGRAGAVTLDVKPGYWVSMSEQRQKVRASPAGVHKR
jgi:calcium-dependent protein kinase